MSGRKGLAGKLKGAVQELAGDVVTLCRHPVYLSTVAGQTLYTGKGSLHQEPPSARSSKSHNMTGCTIPTHKAALTRLAGLSGCLC